MFKEIIMRRSHGEKKSGDYMHNLLGTNGRLTDIQAGIGLAQLKKLQKFLMLRRKVARKYNQYFKKISGITLPKVYKNCVNAYFFYPILINKRDKVASELKRKFGIDTRIAYRMPIYRQNIYKKKLIFKKLNCPVTEKVTSKILNLPIYPNLKSHEIDYIVNSIKKILSK